MLFRFDLLIFTLSLVSIALFFILKNKFLSNIIHPSLAFSSLNKFKTGFGKEKLLSYTQKLHTFAFICLLIALSDFHFLMPLTNIKLSPQIQKASTQGAAIYLALDQSSSMSKKVDTQHKKEGLNSIKKIDLSKRLAKEFIIDHPSDLIGLVTFARVPQILAPLTLDHQMLLDKLQKIQIVEKPEDNGTAIGYAIFKTSTMINATRYFAEEMLQEGNAPYTIKSAALIIITDGFQDPSKLDLGNSLRTIELDDAASYAKEHNIRLFIINVNPDFSLPEYAPHRALLESITKETGGKFYIINPQGNLSDFYKKITALEKGTIIQKPVNQENKVSEFPTKRFSLFPYFTLIGLLSLFSALFFEYFLIKKVP